LSVAALSLALIFLGVLDRRSSRKQTAGRGFAVKVRPGSGGSDIPPRRNLTTTANAASRAGTTLLSANNHSCTRHPFLCIVTLRIPARSTQDLHCAIAAPGLREPARSGQAGAI